MVIKSGLQEFPVSPTYCTDPHLAQSIRYTNVARRADQVVLDGECLVGFDTAEGGGLLQVFFADDAFFSYT